MTAGDLVNASLRTLGVIASGETPSTEESADGLVALNLLVANWTAVNLTIYQLVRDTVALNGSQTYVLATRPVRIKSGGIITAAGLTNNLQLVDASAWAAFADKTATGLLAQIMYCDYGYPSATVYLAPKPSAGTLELWVYRPLATFAALTDTVTFPPGYELALRLNLALHLASEYGRPVPPELPALANNALTAITALNAAIHGDNLPSAPAPAPGSLQVAS